MHEPRPRIAGWMAGAGQMAVRGDGVSILPIRAERLRFDIAGRPLIRIDEFEIDGSGPTLILGPNGGGKSLLLRLLHGLLEPTAGQVSYNGRAMTPDIRRSQAMVFQRPVLLRRSVAANIDYALRAGGIVRGERRRRLGELLAIGNLAGMAHQPARTLSGGEQQRLALIRAVSTSPQVLFLDEPTSSLDPAATLLIEELIVRVSATGTKIVMVTHDIGQAKRLAGEIAFVYRGGILERAPAEEFFGRPASQAAQDFLEGKLAL